jgi:phenylalanyl-tRNA synthetase alpha subunit
VQDLKDALEKDTPQTGLLEQFEQNLKDAQDTKQMNENQYGDSINEKDKLGRDARPLKDRLNTIGGELADIDHRIKKAEARLEKAINKREEEIRKANLSHEQVEMGEHIKARLEKQRDDQISTVNSFTEQAEQVSRRIPIDAGETGDSIEAKLAKLVRDQQRQVAE